MRRLPPNLSVLRNYESKLALLEAEQRDRPDRDLSSIIRSQAEHVEAYRLELRHYNARQAARKPTPGQREILQVAAGTGRARVYARGDAKGISELPTRPGVWLANLASCRVLADMGLIQILPEDHHSNRRVALTDAGRAAIA